VPFRGLQLSVSHVGEQGTTKVGLAVSIRPFVPIAADHRLHVNRGQIQEPVLFIRSVTWERVEETPLRFTDTRIYLALVEAEKLDHDTVT